LLFAGCVIVVSDSLVAITKQAARYTGSITSRLHAAGEARLSIIE
jgi:hypothetical protein